MNKQALRTYIRQVKQHYTASETTALDEIIYRKVMDYHRVKAADTILLYWSLPDEVSTHQLVHDLNAAGKVVLLPRVVSDTDMTLHRFTSTNDMEIGAYGILEPSGDTVSTAELNTLALQGKALAIIPGMAFDDKGNRLGRGKGYYDRLLAHLPALYRIGLCYPFQLLPSVPTQPSDVTMNEIIC